ncbi:hypothetical protein ACQKQD_26070 [Methylobacterium sp. NPDC080182]|uniref:hypothetical protein n=1 Tax=Methylobacterium sp. NPDC080182 TaxID=3390590 RepID=UPI003CFC7465
MAVLASKKPALIDGYAGRRATAVANAKWFHAMAWRALRDGAPKGELRAANARAASRIVIRQAKRDVLISRMAHEALAADL